MDDVGTIITGVATIALASALIWQTSLFKKQMYLAYLPYLVPRYKLDDLQNPLLIIQNIGNGNAADVHLEIKNSQGMILTKIDRYAFTNGEDHTTTINMKENSHIVVTGSYIDMSKKKHTINTAYEYPPKII